MTMRTHVTFRHPAEFVGDQADGGGILAVRGAQWFAPLLKRIEGLQMDEDLCQEDWGVVFFVRRNRKKFWIGLSWFSEGVWLAHFHHGSFAWLQKFSSSGKNELRRLVADAHKALSNEPVISNIQWHEMKDLVQPKLVGVATPLE